MRTEVFCYSDHGGRLENEDTVGCCKSNDGVVAVVSDGLGGQGDGKAASQLVCDLLLRYPVEDGLPDENQIIQLFDFANRELISRQQNSFHMKTTAVFLCITKGKAIWAHVGDSRLYHFWNRKLCEYTLDHSVAQLAVYMRKITRAQIPGDAGQSRLLRALGVADEHPEIHLPITLEKGKHTFLLCSDGLWEFLTDEDIERAESASNSPEQFVECLRALKTARSPENCDNNSAVAVCVEI